MRHKCVGVRTSCGRVCQVHQARSHHVTGVRTSCGRVCQVHQARSHHVTGGSGVFIVRELSHCLMTMKSLSCRTLCSRSWLTRLSILTTRPTVLHSCGQLGHSICGLVDLAVLLTYLSSNHGNQLLYTTTVCKAVDTVPFSKCCGAVVFLIYILY